MEVKGERKERKMGWCGRGTFEMDFGLDRKSVV
jgi:hypothetical protein